MCVCVQYESKAARKREQAAQLTAERRGKQAEVAELQAQAQAASNEAARKEAQLDAHHGTPLPPHDAPPMLQSPLQSTICIDLFCSRPDMHMCLLYRVFTSLLTLCREVLIMAY